MSAPWTDDRVDLLTKLWLDGRSATQIAAEMGGDLTRNAVIGKVHRLGLTEKRAGRVPRPTSAPAAAAAPKPVSAKPVAAAPVVQKPIARPAPAPLPAGPVTILDLRATMCSWPLGDPRSPDFRYCGQRSTHRSYCEPHAQLAYQATQERRAIAAPRLPAQHHPTRITAAA